VRLVQALPYLSVFGRMPVLRSEHWWTTTWHARWACRSESRPSVWYHAITTGVDVIALFYAGDSSSDVYPTNEADVIREVRVFVHGLP
jgi:hypothetical protein